jgi:UDP:flavonoid glycosyltransferase YjiC (YdhE family)
MARIVITTFGSSGDINPYVALGLTLRARGHEVVFAVEEGFRDVVASAGFPVHHLTGDAMAALAPRMTKLLGKTNPLTSMRVLVEDYLVPTLRPRIRDLLAACDGADLLVASASQIAAEFVADLTSIPLVIVTLTPITVPSAYIEPQPQPLPLPPRLQRAANRASWALGTGLVGRIFDQPVNRARAEYGLRPYKHWMYTGASNTAARLVAVAVSPAFCPAPLDWPPFVRETGFLYWDRPSAWHAPEELSAFFAAPGPVVAVSTGSMSLHTAAAFGAFYRDSIAAARTTGARALVIGAPREALPDPLPADVLALPFAPFSEVYPRCAAVIHHGGIGTTAQALRAGAPQLVVPWAVDQFWTGAQVRRIGAGRTVQRRAYTAARASAALRDLLQNPRYRARCDAIAAQIAAEDGAATLCDGLDTVLVGASAGQRVPERNG